ncbi:MAG: flagellar basal-body MS-ring/collar protein FliF [Verrucomicrobiota bacterium]
MNQNVTRIGHQFQDIWKQLGVSQRISVVLATGILLIGIIGVAWWSGRADYTLLYGKLSDTEAAKVIAALDDAKVPYKIGTGGSSVLVPAEKVHVMRMQLAGKGIPRSDGVGFEIFDKPNFGISDFIQRANYIRALQGELARTIAQLDEIESARVMVVMPENRLLIDKDKHSTASVFVRLRSNGQLAPQAINSIRFLVANSVEGLKPNFVAVVDNQGNVLSENVENDSLVGLSATQLDARRNLEQYLAKKTESMLEKVLGPGQAIVRVAAEINFDTLQRTEEKYDPDGQVIRTQTKDESNEDSTTANNNESAGVSANTPSGSNTTAQANSLPTITKNKKTTSTVGYDVGKSTSTLMQSAGGIKRLSAAVTVAAKVEGEGAARKVVARTTDELEKLRRIVGNVLGNDITRGDQITVEELPFNDQFAVEITRNLQTQERRDFWWTLARNVGYPALALGVLVVFLRLFKRADSDGIQLGIPIGNMSYHNGNGNGNGHGNGHGNGNGNGNGYRQGTVFSSRGGPNDQATVTVEVLNQLIKENPQNMTQAIRTWLVRDSSPSK